MTKDAKFAAGFADLLYDMVDPGEAMANGKAWKLNIWNLFQWMTMDILRGYILQPSAAIE